MQWGAKMHRGNTPGHEPSAVIGWPTWWFRASFTLHTPGFMMVYGKYLELVHGCWCRLHCIGITCWEASYWPYPLAASGSQDSCSTLRNEKTIVAQCCFWHFSLYWQVCLTFLCIELLFPHFLGTNIFLVHFQCAHHRQEKTTKNTNSIKCVLTTADHWNTIFKRLRMWWFPKLGYPQIIHYKRIFHWKPFMLGYHVNWWPWIFHATLPAPSFRPSLVLSMQHQSSKDP